MKKYSALFVLVTLLLNSACSSTPEADNEYTLSKSTAPLEVPPDLVLPGGNDEFVIPGIASQQMTYSGYSGQGTNKRILPEPAKNTRLVREGNSAWLELNSSPAKLWPELKRFLQQLGFQLKREDREIGLLETNWVERKDDTAGWLSDVIGVMDKFRVRIERSDKKGVVMVFIRHRGMRGMQKDLAEEERIVWQPRASDSELEVELLQQFLVYRGLNEEQINKLAEKKVRKENSRIVSGQEGKVLLEVDENFARTWRRVGLALDRMGLVVEDRNRSAGVYYIKVPESFELKEEKGIFSDLFSGSKTSKVSYLLSIKSKSGNTTVELRQRSSNKIDEQVAKKVLTRIQAHIS